MSGIQLAPHDVRELAARGEKFSGTAPLAQLSRLAPMLVRPEGEVSVRLAFSCAEDGVPRIDGRLSAAVEIPCQRCLEPVTLDLEVEVHLALVDSEEEGESIRAPYEPWVDTGLDTGVDTGEGVSLADALEDELLLALPLSPMHAPDACGGVAQRAEKLPDSDDDAGMRTPFAGLKDLLRARTRD